MTDPCASLSQAIAAAAGADLAGEPGFCFLCGEWSQTCIPAAKLPKSFRDYDKGRADSKRVCAACIYVMAGKPPNTLRMWSMVWVETGGLPPTSAETAPLSTGRIWTGNKGDLRPALEVAMSPPPCRWAVSLADSGKIHIIPYAPMAGPGRWAIRLERHTIADGLAPFRRVVHVVASLMEAGHSKAAILAGDPHPSTWRKPELIRAWMQHAPALEPWRRSPLLEAAVFLLRDTYAAEFTEDRWTQTWSWQRV